MPDPLDASVLADDEDRGDPRETGGLEVGAVHRSVGVGGECVAGPVVLRQALRLGGAEEERHSLLQLLVTQPDDRYPAVGVLLLQGRKVLHVGDTRCAPGGPELEKVDATRLEPGDRIALQPVGDLEVRRYGAKGQRRRILGSQAGASEERERRERNAAIHACQTTLTPIRQAPKAAC